LRVADYKCFRTNAFRSVIIISTEEVHSHLDFFLNNFFFDNLGGTTGGGRSGRGSGSSSGGGLEGLSLGEAVIGAERDSSQVFESAHNEVGDS